MKKFLIVAIGIVAVFSLILIGLAVNDAIQEQKEVSAIIEATGGEVITEDQARSIIYGLRAAEVLRKQQAHENARRLAGKQARAAAEATCVRAGASANVCAQTSDKDLAAMQARASEESRDQSQQ